MMRYIHNRGHKQAAQHKTPRGPMRDFWWTRVGPSALRDCRRYNVSGFDGYATPSSSRSSSSQIPRKAWMNSRPILWKLVDNSVHRLRNGSCFANCTTSRSEENTQGPRREAEICVYLYYVLNGMLCTLSICQGFNGLFTIYMIQWKEKENSRPCACVARPKQ